MMNNRRPLGTRKKIQVLLAITILVWATQTLLSQWSFGQVTGGAEANAEPAPASAPVAALVPAPTPAGSAFVSLDLDRLRSTLRDAGVNLGVVRFSGPTSCVV